MKKLKDGRVILSAKEYADLATAYLPLFDLAESHRFTFENYDSLINRSYEDYARLCRWRDKLAGIRFTRQLHKRDWEVRSYTYGNATAKVDKATA
jgi:hypothetical protein